MFFPIDCLVCVLDRDSSRRALGPFCCLWAEGGGSLHTIDWGCIASLLPKGKKFKVSQRQLFPTCDRNSMEIRKISEEGRISIPVAIRNKAGLNTGDTVAVRIEGEHIIISKPEPKEDPYLAIAEASLTEWLEAEDEKAWEGLSGPEDNERRKETSGARPQGERRRPEAEP